MGGLPPQASACHPQPICEAQRSWSVKSVQPSVLPTHPVVDVVQSQPGSIRQLILSLKASQVGPPVQRVSPVVQVQPKCRVQGPSLTKMSQVAASPMQAP